MASSRRSWVRSSADSPTSASSSRAEFPKPVVLGPAGVKSWAAFTRKAASWTIAREAGDYVVTASGRGADGQWIADPSSTVRVPVAEGPAAIVAVILRQRNARSDL